MNPRLLIVDDHAGFGRRLRLLLSAEGLEVVGVARDAPDAATAIELLAPDVVLVDVGLPGEDGIALAHRLAGGDDPPDVILMSSRSAHDFGAKLQTAPSRGFIAKDDLCATAVLDALGR